MVKINFIYFIFFMQTIKKIFLKKTTYALIDVNQRNRL